MPDDEMTERAGVFIRDLNLHGDLQKSGACDLSRFPPQSKIYILAHGHSEMPLFSNKNGKWNATQLAKMLKADGLALDQRDIELLVCHAGESVNNKLTASKLLKIASKAWAAKSQGKSLDKYTTEYNSVKKGSTAPTFFEGDPEKLLLPLAAQLAQSLKDLKYSHFRIISYKCPVAQYSGGGGIYLDLSKKGGSWGVKADDNPTYRVIWR